MSRLPREYCIIGPQDKVYYQTLILTELVENLSLSSVPTHRSTVIQTILVVARVVVVVVVVV